MIKKTATVIAFFFLLAVLVFQAHLSVAEAAKPVTYYLITGKVQYLKNGSIVPFTYAKTSAKVTATAGKLQYSQNVQPDGTYQISVQPGNYTVTAADGLKTRFNPARYLLKIIAGTAGINFTGSL